MKERKRKYKEQGPVDFLLLRERLGIGRFRKTLARAPEKREMLLKLWLRTIEEREKGDYIPLGERRRRLKTS